VLQTHDLIVQRPEGLYCPPGDFFIDPWRPVERAVITHAHSDHARSGHRRYLAAAPAALVPGAAAVWPDCPGNVALDWEDGDAA
jgi:Cft2 family RNA processing exonuclease